MIDAFDGCDDHSIAASPDKIEMWINSKDVATRLACLDRPDFHPTMDQVMKGVKDISPLVRVQWAKCRKFVPTEDIIQAGVRDEHWEVRESWVLRDDVHFDISDIHNGLRDPHIFTRCAWVSRHEWTPSVKRIRHMMHDIRPIRESICKRRDVDIPYDCMVKAVSDHYVKVRVACAEHPSIKKYMDLITECMRDKSEQVRRAVIDSHTWRPSESQRILGMNDDDENIRLLWMNRIARLCDESLCSEEVHSDSI